VEDESCEWIKTIDRGGLNHVSENMYWFTTSMELESEEEPQHKCCNTHI